MALRTENMVIILKFRFIIQDIHQQLKMKYRDQQSSMKMKDRHGKTLMIELLMRIFWNISLSTFLFSTMKSDNERYRFYY